MKNIYRFILHQLFVIGICYFILSLTGESFYYNQWNQLANFFSIPMEIGFCFQFFRTLEKNAF